MADSTEERGGMGYVLMADSTEERGGMGYVLMADSTEERGGMGYDDDGTIFMTRPRFSRA